jgi:hypothetical protein
MSYTVDGDGKVTFRCQGKDCGKTKEARTVKVLPKKWCITGILLTQADPEGGESALEDAAATNNRLLEANSQLSGHFCSFKCAKNTFSDERVVAMVKKLRVAVVVYGDCKLVIDAENLDGGGDDGEGEDEPAPKRPKCGSRDDDDSPRGVSPKGLDRPDSPPPFTLPESSSPGF